MNIVEAVKTEGEAEVIARKLALNAKGNTLYADIWRFGVNTALRISDLLSLPFADVKGDKLVIVESKTGKSRTIHLNSSAKAIIERRMKAHPDHAFLFQVDSNRAKNKPVSRVAVATAFKAVGDELGIQLGTHSMRKTRGWLMYSAGVSIEMICKVLNHSSPAVTMAYIGITQAEVDATYHEFVF
ncbi:tyrosine-type recombinase/integrase [Pseudomonas gregormendelii]|uniref:Tyrosine-type recombinase/integrase n=1 Tax=Pseudomonas gregormendelii TaxID=1628277 RepID=A0ABS3AAV6_9PSED|nr:tyrosine-type recombinase/integrase [Pseudomonas gregormendelii]MBN3964317.1 tyrosine-type recombinase/integrase [Pseudomonas gregormendelii]